MSIELGKALNIVWVFMATVASTKLFVELVRELPNNYPRKNKWRRRRPRDWAGVIITLIILVGGPLVLYSLWKRALKGGSNQSQYLSTVDWHEPIVWVACFLTLSMTAIIYYYSPTYQIERHERISKAIKVGVIFFTLTIATRNHLVVGLVVGLPIAALLIHGTREEKESSERTRVYDESRRERERKREEERRMLMEQRQILEARRLRLENETPEERAKREKRNARRRERYRERKAEQAKANKASDPS